MVLLVSSEWGGGAFQGGKPQARDPVVMPPGLYLSPVAPSGMCGPLEPTSASMAGATFQEGVELLFPFVTARAMGWVAGENAQGSGSSQALQLPSPVRFRSFLDVALPCSLDCSAPS